jgi:hypothetical protein
MKVKLSFALIAAFFFNLSQSHAAITLLDKEEWKFLISGFIQADAFNDSSKSFTEVAGNNPVTRLGTYNGDNGRSQFSIRNSRFAFSILAPSQDDWKSKGYLEYDLLGFDPSPGVSGNNESGFYTNATLRVRHAYIEGVKNGLQILVGQYWTLFGWQPAYVLTTASVPPVAGSAYQRTPQILAIKSFEVKSDNKIQAGVSVARPSQRDSQLPNIDGGARFIMASRSSGFASPSSDIKAEPMSLGLSGTLRQFSAPTSGGATTDKFNSMGGAFAIDTLIPLISSIDNKDTKGTLTFTAEFTSGSGYTDAFPGMNGNLGTLTQAALPSGASSSPNLDAGQAGFDSSGNFQLVKLQTFNSQIQYHLPTRCRLFVNAGYGQLYSPNMGSLTTPSLGSTVLYDKSETSYLNMFDDLTNQIRLAVEYAQIRTHYIDNQSAQDNRVQLSAWFRF